MDQIVFEFIFNVFEDVFMHTLLKQFMIWFNVEYL